MTGPGLLARIDRCLAELQAIRSELAGASLGNDEVRNSDVEIADDLAEANLLDTHAASARFGYSRDSIARWAREGCGVKQGGRWLVSVPKLQRRLNGK